MYAASGIRNQLVKINPRTKQINVLTPTPYNPLGNLEPFNDLWTTEDGMLFSQTTGNVITFYNYSSGSFTNYKVPTPAAGPLGLYVASDGLAYFTEFFAQKIATFNPATAEFKEYPILNPLGFGPAVIRAETPGLIWFTALIGGSIGSFDMTTHEIKIYPNNTPLSLPCENTVSADGRVWFSTISQDSINYIDPSSGRIANIPQPGTLIPAPISLPFTFEVAINYKREDDGLEYIWFANAATNQVGRYRL